MIKYRKLTSLTDNEIKQILTDIFAPIKIENMVRDKDDEIITADITTGGWDDGETHGFEVTDEIEMTTSTIKAPFSITSGDCLLYKKFLLAKGCDYRLKNNPYIHI